MSVRTTPRRLVRTLLASAALIAGVLAVAPAAHADEATDSPVTVGDSLSLQGRGTGFLDVLANDTDPNGDALELCRVEVPDGVPIDASPALVAIDHSGLKVRSTANRTGTYEITYYACDLDYLTPATVTVHVTKAPPAKPVRAAKVAGHPGRVTFTNPGNQRITVLIGDRRSGQLDDLISVPAHKSRTISTTRRSLFYVAIVEATGMRAGHGTVRNIKQPKHAANLPSNGPLPLRVQHQWRLAL